MDLRRQVGVLQSWAALIIVGTVVTALVAFAIGSVLPKVYETDARLLVGQALESSTPNVDQFATAQSLAATYGELASSRRVLEPVLAKLGLPETLDAFRERIAIRTQERQPFIDIVATGATPEEAKAIVDGIAAELVAISKAVVEEPTDVSAFNDEDLDLIRAQIVETRDELERLVDIATPTVAQQDRIDTLQTRLLSLRSAYAALLQATPDPQSNRLTVIDGGDLAVRPTSPGPLFTLVLGAILGLLAMIAAVFVWETVDDRIRSADDIERVTGLGVIGSVLKMPGDRGRGEIYRLATLLYPRSPAAEAFRALRTNLDFAALDQRYRTIVVTSAAPHEGKTVVAANLAIAYAQGGKQVILVDADLRLPGVQMMFGLPDAVGLTDLARSDAPTLDDVLHATEVPGLRILTAGTIPPNPAELLGSQRMKTLISRLLGVADVLVIDTAPVGIVTDAALLAVDADATILVVRESFASERIVRRGREALAAVNAHVAGVVLNFVRPRGGEADPYFGAYLDTGSEATDVRTAVAPATAVHIEERPTAAPSAAQPTRRARAAQARPRPTTKSD
ncbi:MAG: polysaccharide biosynthesis tyrosine autokinase [Candidatus Limnocylindrales bacterium]